MDEITLLPVLGSFEPVGSKWVNSKVRGQKMLSFTVEKKHLVKNNSTTFTDLKAGPVRDALYLLTNMFSPQNLSYPGGYSNFVNQKQKNQLENQSKNDQSSGKSQTQGTNDFQNAFFYEEGKPRFQCYVETLVRDIKGRDVPTESQFSEKTVSGYRFFVITTSNVDLNQSAKNVFYNTKKNNANAAPDKAKTKKASNSPSTLISSSTYIEFISKIWRVFKKSECTSSESDFDICDLFNLKENICLSNEEVSVQQKTLDTYFKSGKIPGAETLHPDIPYERLCLHVTQSSFSNILNLPIPSCEVHKIMELEEEYKYYTTEMETADAAIHLMNKSGDYTTKDINEMVEHFSMLRAERETVKLKQLHLMDKIRTNNVDIFSNVADKDKQDELLKLYCATMEARDINMRKRDTFIKNYGTALKAKDPSEWATEYKRLQLELFETHVSCLEKQNIYNITKSALKRLNEVVIDERKSKYTNLCRPSEYIAWLNSFIKKIMTIDRNLVPLFQLMIVSHDGICFKEDGMGLGAMIRGGTGAGKTFAMKMLEIFSLDNAIISLGANSEKSLTNDGRHFSGSTVFQDEMSLRKQGLNEKGQYLGSTEQSDSFKNLLTNPFQNYYVYDTETDPLTGDKKPITRQKFAMLMFNWIWTGNQDCPNQALVRRFLWISMSSMVKTLDSNVVNHCFESLKDTSLNNYPTDMFKNDHALYVMVEEMITTKVLSEPKLNVYDQICEIIFKELQIRGLPHPDETILKFIKKACRVLTIMSAIDSCFRAPHNYKYRQTPQGEPRYFELKDLLDIDPYLVCTSPIVFSVLSLFRNNFLGIVESEVIETVFNRINHWPPLSDEDENVNFQETKTGKNENRISYWQPLGANGSDSLLFDGLKSFCPSNPSEHDLRRACRSLGAIKSKKVMKWLNSEEEKKYNEKYTDLTYKEYEKKFGKKLISNKQEVIKPSKQEVSENSHTRKKIKIESSDIMCSVCSEYLSVEEEQQRAYLEDKDSQSFYHIKCGIQCSNTECNKVCFPNSAIFCGKPNCDHVFCSDECRNGHKHFVVVDGADKDSQPLLTIQRVVHPKKGAGWELSMSVGAPAQNWDSIFDEILETVNHKYVRGEYDVITFQNYEGNFELDKDDPKRNRVEKHRLATIFKTIKVKKNPEKVQRVTNTNYWDEESRHTLEIDDTMISEADHYPFLDINSDFDAFAILERCIETGAPAKMLYEIHPYDQKNTIREYQDLCSKTEGLENEYSDDKLKKEYPTSLVENLEKTLNYTQKSMTTTFDKRFTKSSLTPRISISS